jgi:hypothetical protein
LSIPTRTIAKPIQKKGVPMNKKGVVYIVEHMFEITTLIVPPTIINIIPNTISLGIIANTCKILSFEESL